MSKIQQRKDIRDFVLRHKAMGEEPDAIAALVNARWKGWNMTARGVTRIGVTHRMGDPEKREGAPVVATKPKPTTCHYVLVTSGRDHLCGAEGYPYCPNHRSKVATGPSGPKYHQMARIY